MKRVVFALLLFCVACQNNYHHVNDIHIQVDKAHNQVKVTGVSHITLQGIKRDTLNTMAWLNLFPVCSMPSDTDMRAYQPPLTGSYHVSGDAITFTPDVPFKSGQTYFARYYRYDKPITSMDLLLHKRSLGKATYIELIFKY